MKRISIFFPVLFIVLTTTTSFAQNGAKGDRPLDKTEQKFQELQSEHLYNCNAYNEANDLRQRYMELREQHNKLSEKLARLEDDKQPSGSRVNPRDNRSKRKADQEEKKELSQEMSQELSRSRDSRKPSNLEKDFLKLKEIYSDSIEYYIQANAELQSQIDELGNKKKSEASPKPEWPKQRQQTKKEDYSQNDYDFWVNMSDSLRSVIKDNGDKYDKIFLQMIEVAEDSSKYDQVPGMLEILRKDSYYNNYSCYKTVQNALTTYHKAMYEMVRVIEYLDECKQKKLSKRDVLRKLDDNADRYYIDDVPCAKSMLDHYIEVLFSGNASDSNKSDKDSFDSPKSKAGNTLKTKEHCQNAAEYLDGKLKYY